MTLWRGESGLVLASRSRARQTLLGNAGIPFDLMPAEIDERRIQHDSGLVAPGDVAALLAREKAVAVALQWPHRLVLGADQTLCLGRQIFSKPEGRAQARAQLSTLAGATHELHSAVAVVRDGRLVFEATGLARMTMRPLNAVQIDAYLDTAGEAVNGSVGAYQLEGLGVHLFERIEGDHFTILGLPLLPLLDFLRRERLLAV
jgi:nucleoside triphosphate pyrophosphatase